MKTKKAILFVVLLALIITLPSCAMSNEKRQLFAVATGDEIDLHIDKKSDFVIEFDAPYLITKNGETYLEGGFADANTFDQLRTIVSYDTDTSVIDEYEKDVNKYFIFESRKEDAGTEYFTTILIAESNTCATLISSKTREDTLEAVNALTFTLRPAAPFKT